MAPLTWTDALTVGVKESDEQHRALVAQVNALKQRFDTGGLGLDAEVAESLGVWLTEHIVEGLSNCEPAATDAV